MARPRYPSDEKRARQRPHVKVHLSWMTHPHYAAAFADYEVRAIVLGVWMIAAQAHASATDDLVTLNPGLICSVTGRQQLRSALPALCRACASMQWTITRHIAGVTIHVRNFSKKQGFTPQLRSGVRVAPHDSASLRRTEEPSTEEPSQRREEKSERPAAEPAGTHPDPPPGPIAEVEPWRPLLNLMAKLEGAPDEKAAWLEANWDHLQAEAEARQLIGKAATPKSLLFGFYRVYLRNGSREFRDADKKRREREAINRWSAEQRAKYGVDPNVEAKAYIEERARQRAAEAG